jgi:hypothetical protein
LSWEDEGIPTFFFPLVKHNSRPNSKGHDMTFTSLTSGFEPKALWYQARVVPLSHHLWGTTNMLNILNILSKSIPNDALFTNIHHLQHIDLIIPFPTHLVKKWTIQSSRTFKSCHLDQSLWLANQKKSFPFSAAHLVHTTLGLDNVKETISHNLTSCTSPKSQCFKWIQCCA